MLAPVPVPASDGSSIVEAKVDSRIALVARAKHINWERGRVELQQIYAVFPLSQPIWPFHVPKGRTTNFIKPRLCVLENLQNPPKPQPVEASWVMSHFNVRL